MDYKYISKGAEELEYVNGYAEKELCPRADLVDKVKNSNFDILMTLGAADLDRLLPEFTEILTQRY